MARFVRVILFALLTIAVIAVPANIIAVPPNQSQGAGKRPNILLILTDDHNVGLGYSSLHKTMALFRAGGTEFTNAVNTTPLCCPARASILTGQYVHNHGQASNSATERWYATHLSSVYPTDLHDAGYMTAISGKLLNAYANNPPGYDRWAVQKNQLFYDAWFNINGVVAQRPEYSTTLIGDHAVQFLNDFETSDDAAPWYMQVSPVAPHSPSTPEEKYKATPVPPWQDNPATTETDLTDKPDWVQQDQSRKSFVIPDRKKRLRSLMSVDDQVARIFAQMDALGETDNTLAIFMSDNGFMLYDHGLYGKRSPYEQSTRIPLFLRWPRHVAQGAIDSRIVANIDIAPTIYEVSGAPPDHVIDGRSLLGPSARSDIFLEYLTVLTDRSAVEVNPPVWRAIWNPTRTYVRYASGEREYYGPQDPWQLTNVYKDGVIGNEPAEESALDLLIDQNSSCNGTNCR